MNEPSFPLKVTVVTNVYNSESTIESYLDSLAKQKFTEFELVIVDDGSTDHTMQLVEKYRPKFNLKTIQLPHIGLVLSRARGIEDSSGEICIVLDADELFDDPSIISKFLEPFTDSLVGAVGGNIKSIDRNWVTQGINLERQLRHNLRKNREEGRQVAGGVMALRKSALESIGGLTKNPEIVEDIDLSIRLRKNGWKIVIRDDIVVQHPDPSSIAGLLKWAFKQGINFTYIIKAHPKMIFDFRLLLVFTTLWIVLISILFWPFAVLLMILSFPFVQLIFSKTPSTFLTRSYGWVVLWLRSTGITCGFLVGSGKIITKAIQTYLTSLFQTRPLSR